MLHTTRSSYASLAASHTQSPPQFVELSTEATCASRLASRLAGPLKNASVLSDQRAQGLEPYGETLIPSIAHVGLVLMLHGYIT